MVHLNILTERDHIVLDLAEPDLHLMQPSTIRRRDMEWHVGMRGHDAATALAW